MTTPVAGPVGPSQTITSTQNGISTDISQGLVSSGDLNNAALKAAQAIIATLAAQHGNLNINGQSAQAGNLNLIEIAPPGTSNSLSNSLEISANIQASLLDNSDALMSQNAGIFNANAASMQLQAEGLDYALVTSTDFADQANALLESNGGDLLAATTEKNAAEADLQQLDPHDPKLQTAQTRLQLANLSLNLSKATRDLDEAKNNPDLNSTDLNVKNAATALLSVANNKFEDAKLALSGFSSAQLALGDDAINSASSMGARPTQQILQRQLSARGKLMELLATIGKLMQNAAKEKLEREQVTNKKMQEVRQASLDKTAKEDAEQVEKAAKMNYAMGCVGKIIAAIMIVIGAIVSVATAITGVGIAIGLMIAAVGVALLVADCVLEAQGKTSVTDQIMGPIMEKIIQPMIDLMTKMLTAMGIPEEVAKGLAMGLVAAIMLYAIVATIVILKGSAGSLAAKLGEKFGESTAKSIAQKIATMIMKEMSNFAGKTATKLSGVVEKVVKAMEYSRSIGGFTGTAVKSSNSIVQAKFQEWSAEKRSKMTIDISAIDTLRDLILEAMENYSSGIEAVQKITNKIPAVIQSSVDVGKRIATDGLVSSGAAAA